MIRFYRCRWQRDQEEHHNHHVYSAIINGGGHLRAKNKRNTGFKASRITMRRLTLDDDPIEIMIQEIIQ